MTVGLAEKNGFSAARLGRIRPCMQRYVDEGQLAGIATLVARNGEIVHLSTVGQADIASGKPLGEDAIYRIYSMSKPVVVAAASRRKGSSIPAVVAFGRTSAIAETTR